jgi:hypothetical protein
MGDVYLAEQERPMRRRVAIKVIKRGMDSKEVIARFESERQALALMSHPGIARVFDAGSTEDVGRSSSWSTWRVSDHRVLRPPGLDGRARLSSSTRSAWRSSTRTRRGSSTATSSPPTSSCRWRRADHDRK